MPAESPASPVVSDAAAADVAAERERVLALLTRAYAADWLTEAELQARLDRAFLATTVAELQGVLVGMPSDPEAVPETAGMSVTALLSGEEQRPTGALPRRLRLEARLGYVQLDLTRARFQEGVTEIHVDALAGYVEIRLPADVRAESAGSAFLGYFTLRGGRLEPDAGAPVVKITGRAVLGYMECQVFDRAAGGLSALEPPL